MLWVCHVLLFVSACCGSALSVMPIGKQLMFVVVLVAQRVIQPMIVHIKELESMQRSHTQQQARSKEKNMKSPRTTSQYSIHVGCGCCCGDFSFFQAQLNNEYAAFMNELQGKECFITTGKGSEQ